MLLTIIVCTTPSIGYCQTDSSIQKASSIVDRFSTKMLLSIDGKYKKLEHNLTAYSERSLKRLQRQERKLKKKLAQKDSLAAKSIFESSDAQYASMLQKIQNPTDKLNASALNNYIPKLDSLQTTFNFLNKTGAKIPGIPPDKLAQFQTVSNQLKSLQTQLQSTADIKKFIKERKQLLTDQLSKFGMGDQLKQINKQVYYYQQQITEYKNLMSDPDKLEQKALGVVRNIPAFKDFISKNSILAQLFPMPNGYGTADALIGLQTRIGVQQQLSQRLGGAGANPQQYLQQQVQAAQSQMDALKDKVNKLGGSSDMAMPDFKPNNQKTKSFWKRIEYGLNIQSQKTNAFLPTTSDIALTMGYKLNDKSTIGVGAGYKLGWGNNISIIKLTSQGVSLRSYLDIKLKGSIWISGGYEENYQHEFTKIDHLKDMDAWQKSGLIGLTKKYKVGKKNGNIQLLWDFLSYSQVPQTPGLKFRFGYAFLK